MAISAISGICHNGKIEPLEDIPCKGDKKVIIVFLDDLKDKIWDKAVAKDFFEGVFGKGRRL